MKTYLTILTAACAVFAGPRAVSQTINWGSPMFSDLVDSHGRLLDDTFSFELGAFVPGFNPEDHDVSLWASNWRTFDSAIYNGIETPEDDGIYGYFTSSVQMLPGGYSSNPAYNPDANPAVLGLNFQDLQAYLWIRNGTNPQPGTEWLLSRAIAWNFPTYGGCCPNGAPLQWSVSNLTTSDVPLYGKQGVVAGLGVSNDPNPANSYALQTYSFVPESSTAVLVTLTGMVLALRRRRGA